MKNMKKVVSIFMCVMMLVMLNPVTSHASGTWYKTTFSRSNTASATSSSFKSINGNISCSYTIKPSTAHYVSKATFVLQLYANGTWYDYESKTVTIKYPSCGGSVTWNKYMYNGTYRIKFSCNQRVTSVKGTIRYFQSSN